MKPTARVLEAVSSIPQNDATALHRIHAARPIHADGRRCVRRFAPTSGRAHQSGRIAARGVVVYVGITASVR